MSFNTEPVAIRSFLRWLHRNNDHVGDHADGGYRVTSLRWCVDEHDIVERSSCLGGCGNLLKLGDVFSRYFGCDILKSLNACSLAVCIDHGNTYSVVMKPHSKIDKQSGFPDATFCVADSYLHATDTSPKSRQLTRHKVSQAVTWP